MPKVKAKAKGNALDLGPLFQLKDHPSIPHPKGPLLICVLDGWGESTYKDEFDAALQADTPTMDRLRESAPDRWREVQAHGVAVGLPSDADMGNSEVGHNALGAGQIVDQGAKCVDNALDEGTVWEHEGWEFVKEAAKTGTLHLIGLLSDGGVHSRYDQLEKLVEGALERGVKRVRFHVLHDGRDCSDDTAVAWIERLAGDAAKWSSAHDADCRIASGGGRMRVTMDRYDSDWDIVRRGYEAHVLGEAPNRFEDPVEGVRKLKEAVDENGKTVSDQYVDAWVVVEKAGEGAAVTPASPDGMVPVGTVQDGDAVVVFNFRADRVIEISKAIEYENFDAFERKRWPDVRFAGMMQYDGELKLPAQFLVPPPNISRASEQYLIASGVSVFACSESQKIGHVTFFWNGNRSGYLDPKLEHFDHIKSDTGISFDQKPQMKAEEIADDVIKALKSGVYKVVRCNFPNPDMVGHTGNLAATIEACTDTDAALGKLLRAVDEVGGIFLVTADHGNCEDMVKRDKKGVPQRDANGVPIPLTSHTLNPVGVAIGGPGLPANVVFDPAVERPGLSNVAATYVNLLGFQAPDFYTHTLVKVLEGAK